MPTCGVSDKTWNEIVVDDRGNAYVNGIDGIVALVAGDGPTRQVGDGLAFPNGMVVTPDNATLTVAESHARRLTAFEIAADGASRAGACGPTSATARRTASASMRRTPSGTETFPTSGVCASGKVGRCCKRSPSTAAVSPARSEARTGGRYS
jgi:hypothetical protein